MGYPYRYMAHASPVLSARRRRCVSFCRLTLSIPRFVIAKPSASTVESAFLFLKTIDHRAFHLTLNLFLLFGCFLCLRRTLDPFLNGDVFAVVREGYSRLVSEFNYVCGKHSPWKNMCDGTRLYDRVYMNEWLRDWLQQNAPGVRGHKASQYDYVVEPHNKVRMTDHVLVMEDLTKQFADLTKAFGREEIQLNKRVNVAKSEQSLGVDDLDDETIRLINEKYPNDFEPFGYEKRISSIASS